MADNEIIRYTGTNIAQSIVPFTSIDEYPTHQAEFGKGGFRSVELFSDLATIPMQRREEGMLVYCIENKYAYQWLNGDWVKSKIGGGVEKISGTINDITIENNPELFEDGNIVYSEETQEYYYYLIDNSPEEGDGHWYRWGQMIHVGPDEPTSRGTLWVDTHNHHYNENSESLYSIKRAIEELQEQVGLLMTLRTSGVISGDISDGTRTALIDSADSEKPRIKLELEAQEYEDDKENLESWFESAASVVDLYDIYNPIQSYLILKLEVYQSSESTEQEKESAYETITDTIDNVILISQRKLDDIIEILEDETLAQTLIQTLLEARENPIPDLIQGTVNFLELLLRPEFDNTTQEIKPETDIEPTVRHISIKMGTWEQLTANLLNFVPGELMWCTDRNRLYIYVNGALVVISGNGGGDPYEDETMTELEIKNLIHKELQQVESIGFIPVGSDTPKYTAKVDQYGRLIVYEMGLDNKAEKRNTSISPYYMAESAGYSGLHVNSFYLGGDGDEHSYQPCSHNFVELGNSLVGTNGKGKDISLEGYYLCYYKISSSASKWEMLPLWGKIPAGGTFLIRGAQCSVMNVNTTKVKINNFDMEWRDEDGELIKFSYPGAFYLVRPDFTTITDEVTHVTTETDTPIFYPLASQPDVISDSTPAVTSSNPGGVLKDIYKLDPNNNITGLCNGYIDLVGFGADKAAAVFYEKNPYTLKANSPFKPKDVIFHRWYQLDPVSQSNPGELSKLNNKKYFTATYINGGNHNNTLEIITPKASWEKKSIATGRTLFSETYPSTLTCTFGSQATDNTVVEFWEETEAITTPNATLNNETLPDVDEYEIGNVIKLSNNKYYILKSSTPKGIGATRCFCWNSVGYYNEGIEIRKVGNMGFGLTRPWFKVESIKEGSNLELPHDINLIDDAETVMYPDFISVVDVETNTIVGGDIYEDINKNNSIIKPYYNRIRWESAYGQPITTHRVIIRGLKAGVYEYKVYREGDESYTNKDGRPRRFVIRTDSDVVENGFNFVQTTDQQGANWEEYEVWNLSAKIIKRENEKWEDWKNRTICNEFPEENDTFSHNIGDKIEVDYKLFILNGYELKSISESTGAIELNNLSIVQINDSYLKIQYSWQSLNELPAGIDPEDIPSYEELPKFETNSIYQLNDIILVENQYYQLKEYILVVTSEGQGNIVQLNLSQSVKVNNGYFKITPIWSDKEGESVLPDYDFTINTGDICYNGSRSNEWIDYYVGYEPLDDKVEMFTVGNNDLSPITMRDIGTGSESPWKVGVDVTDYFYTFEIDPLNPQIFEGKAASGIGTAQYKMPSLYSFNYGQYHFLSLLSEIRTISTKASESFSESTVNTIFGVKDELRGENTNQSSKIFDVEEGWIIKDLIKWKNGGSLPLVNGETDYWTEKLSEADPIWKNRDQARYNDLIKDQKCRNCVVFTHEMPFNIITDKSYYTYQHSSITAPRETAKAYLNRFHNFEYQRLFKIWGISMVIGGHKHTCAITNPVYDALKGYNPIYKGFSEPDQEQPREDEIMRDGTNPYFDAESTYNPFIQLTPEDFVRIWNGNTFQITAYCGEVYNNSSKYITKNGDRLEYSNSGGGNVVLGPKTWTRRDGTDENNQLGLMGQKGWIQNEVSLYNSTVRIEIVDKVTTPYYIMCQATGFKNKSNSDLASGWVTGKNASDPSKAPGGPIPWEKFYVPTDNISGQSYPFYTLYKFIHEEDRDMIKSYMYRIRNMYVEPTSEGSKAGYWDLTNYYLTEDLEYNRNQVLNKCISELYNKDTENKIYGTTIII